MNHYGTPNALHATVSMSRLFLICIILSVSILFRLPDLQAETLIPFQVKKGTNLIKFSAQYCTNPSEWTTIAERNALKPPYTIVQNSTLLVPMELLELEKVQAVISSVTGKVRFIDQDKVFENVKVGDNFSQGMTIETEPDSYALIVFPDQKFIHLAPGSSLTLNYAFRLRDGNLKVETQVNKGETANSIDVKLKDNESFRSRTPSVLAGVRGTEFRVKAVDGASSIVETLRGEVTAANSTQKNVTITADHGIKTVIGRPLGTPIQLPATPSLANFPDTFKIQPLSIILPDHSKAKTIRLTISTDQRGMESVLEKSGTPGQKINLILPQDGSYFAFFSAIDAEGFESIPSQACPFLLRTIPATPVSSEPKPNSTVFQPSVKFSWLETDTAVLYRGQLAEDKEFHTLVDQFETDQTFFETKPLPSKDYYFRIQSQAADGFTSLYSEVIKFKVTEPPQLPQEPVVADKIEIRWTPMGENLLYDIDIASDASFTSIVSQGAALSEPRFAPSNSLQPGKYFIRIRALMDDGQKTPWMPTLKLTINPAPLSFADMLLMGIIGLCTLL